MPTAFQLVETTFPQPNGQSTDEQITEIYDYLFVLLEQLRYTLFNLDTSNMNQNALDGFLQSITDPIYARIKDDEENINDLSITAQGLSAQISDANQNITQLSATSTALAARLSTAEGNITSLGATANGLSARISTAEGNITSLNATASGLQAQVSGKIDSSQAQSLIDQAIDGISMTVSSGENGTTFKLKSNGVTIASTGAVDLYVDAVNVYGTLTAGKLQSDEIGILDSDGNECGTIYTTWAASSDYKIEIDSSAIELFAEDGSLFLGSIWNRTNKYGASVEIDGNSAEVQIKGDVIPNKGDYYNLGYSSFMWSDIYCSTGELNGSDENIKHDIEDLPEKYVAMLDMVAPKRYKLNSGTSDRYHVGFIAQDVEAAMSACGIDSKEFGGWAKAKDENDNDMYLLRYTEFIAILLAKLRGMDERLKRLEGTA